ncbi:hypothetical protein CSUI_010399 [Cystoisospora suis]|uniref:Uncharacterized protein n=1 Tax=Cystoisospora suis TaxID=483139 RepID=A0A2C6KF89_9APIC|nr:hypothetical protein CSUI_010399 [Cystoisospora suis]
MNLWLSVTFGLFVQCSFWFSVSLDGTVAAALPSSSVLRLLQRADEVGERSGILPSLPELSALKKDDDEEDRAIRATDLKSDRGQEEKEEATSSNSAGSDKKRPEREAKIDSPPSPSAEESPVERKQDKDPYNTGNGILPSGPLDELEDRDLEQENEKEAAPETKEESVITEEPTEEEGDPEDPNPTDDDEVEPEEDEVEDDDHYHHGEDGHHNFDFQYYLPQQYRKVIPGTNIDYYDYVLMEERQANGEVDEPPVERSGGLPNEEDATEKPLPVVSSFNGVFSYCYATETADILERCSDAATLGDGVYIPMVNMTDFGRHDDDEIGNPAIQDVSLPAKHYSTSRQPFPSEWFETISELKNRTRLSVGGLWFGPPDFDQMDAVLQKNPGVFDGILVDWDSGVGACMTKLKTPPRFNRRGRQTAWADPKKFFMRYYTGGQDIRACHLPGNGLPYTAEPFINDGNRELMPPPGWNVTFPCFGGLEGRCYRSITQHAKDACGESQRFVFSPFDRASESMRILLNDTCAGFGQGLPPHDLVMAI